jgi:hypothetical protein
MGTTTDITVTTAPEVYDFSQTETVKTHLSTTGRTYRLVKTTGDDYQRRSQRLRYGSGNHLGIDWSKADQFLSPDDLDALLGGINIEELTA